MSRFNRPTQISTILKTISSEQGVEATAELETYIATLEGNQQPLLPQASESPYWRSVRRQKERVEHALRKQNNNQ